VRFGSYRLFCYGATDCVLWHPGYTRPRAMAAIPEHHSHAYVLQRVAEMACGVGKAHDILGYCCGVLC
jgi:hypothetical protein